MIFSYSFEKSINCIPSVLMPVGGGVTCAEKRKDPGKTARYLSGMLF
jgi:hypothetical protein